MEGFDAKFDPPLDKRFECPICLLAQREPMQTPCGHRFCSACILRALRETGPRCPVDNTRVAVHQLFKDNFAKREVLSLHVHCHGNECTWHGELRKLEQHEKGCGLMLINCPNECGHKCLRRDIYEHLPSCSNQPTLCSLCSISFNKNKIGSHAQQCSKIKLPEPTLGDISKANEILKWSGHLKMKLHGQNYSIIGYLTAKMDSEERFIHFGSWSSNINLIPLTGSASRIFWKTLQGPEVKPLELFFNVLVVDSRSAAFQKLTKKKINAVTGLKPKITSDRRELTILYIYWSDTEKRMKACVAELQNYLVQEMQNKLQQLKRTSQLNEITLETSRSGSHRGGSSSRSTASGSSSHSSQPGSERRGGGASLPRRPPYNNLRFVNVPPSGPPVSVEPSSHLPSSSRVLSSLLSWQLSPSFPPYPWRAAPSVPFFTIPSTPPQFLPAHSYPYMFAPMPAIAAPSFSINPGRVPVPASIAIPSYAGVAVPRVTGLHAELVVTTASDAPLPQGGATMMEGGRVNNVQAPPNAPPTGLAAAVIHSFPPQTVPPDHPLGVPPNQVSVVVDPRGGIVGAGGEVPTAQTTTEPQPWSHQWQAPPSMARANWFGETSSQNSSSSSSSNPSSSSGASQSDSNRPSQSARHHRQTSSPSSLSSPFSLPFFSPMPPGGLESSDDDLSDVNSPLHWPNGQPSSTRTPRTGSSNEQSPSSSNSSNGDTSALQALADAAALLSSPTPSVSDTEEIISYYDSDSSSQNSSFAEDADPNHGIYLQIPPRLSHPAPPPNHIQTNGNVLAVPAGGHGYAPPQAYRHQSSTLEEVSLFVPVIHPPVEEQTGPAQVLYPAQERGVILPPQQQIAEVPSLIHMTAQGSHNIVPVQEPWPAAAAAAAIVESQPGAAYIPRPIIPANGPHPHNGGGFWEEVMPSLLHEGHAPQ